MRLFEAILDANHRALYETTRYRRLGSFCIRLSKRPAAPETYALGALCEDPDVDVLVLTREADYHERYRSDDKLQDGEEIDWPVPFWYVDAGATLMLGFIWSLWDEDHFTWQDRISQTYITAAAPLSETPSLNVSAGRHRFAHK